MTLNQLFVHGLPKAQARHRAVSRGKFVHIYSPMTEWRESVKYEAARHKPIIAQALDVKMAFYFDRPKSHFGTGRNSGKLKSSAPRYHTKKPDVDNLAKAVLDAFQDAGLIKDDCIVVTLLISKFYTDGFLNSKQGCNISILGLDWIVKK